MTTPTFPPPFPPSGYPPDGGFQPPGPVGRPPVLNWFLAYCVFMALVYAACVVGGAWVLSVPEAEMASRDIDPIEMRIQGTVLLAIGLPLMAAFGMAPFLPPRKWVWVYDIVLVAIGLTSPCCMPATIPLLIFFIKPQTKAWFDSGRVAS